jgi:hypothetical protein
MPERTPAQIAAFEKAKAARAAALEKKRMAALPSLPPIPPTPPATAEPEPEPEPETPAPDSPTSEVPEPMLPPTQPEDDDELEFLDPEEMLAPLLGLINKQSEMIEGLSSEVKGIRQHQQDLSQSFTAHGVKQQFSLSFV